MIIENQEKFREKPEVMTIDEVAEYLRCHQSTIYRLLKKRAIPAWRLGSDWRFNRKAIVEWAAKQQDIIELK